MKILILSILMSLLLGCLPRKKAEASSIKETTEMCYRDFFETIEGDALARRMEMENLERAGESLQNFGLYRSQNYLDSFYLSTESAAATVNGKWGFLDFFKFNGYSEKWVKWGLPDKLEEIELKLKAVERYLGYFMKRRNQPGLSYLGHEIQIDINVKEIRETRDKIVSLINSNPSGLASIRASNAVAQLDDVIERNFGYIEESVGKLKSLNPRWWSENIVAEWKADMANPPFAQSVRLKANDDFLLSVSRFISAPPQTLLRGTDNVPLSAAPLGSEIIRGADKQPIKFRSYAFVDGTRSPIFVNLSKKGIGTVVFFDGVEGVERRIIFIGKDPGVADSLDATKVEKFGLNQAEYRELLKWHPADAADGKTLTAVRTDIVHEIHPPNMRRIEDGDVCPICLDDLSLDSKLFACSSCCNAIHKGCMQRMAGSIAASVKCPLCRVDVDSQLILNDRPKYKPVD